MNEDPFRTRRMAALLLAGVIFAPPGRPPACGQVVNPQVEGKQTVVVYNRKMESSRALAEYYAERRGIPSDQVFGFDLPEGESMSRSEFRGELQEPLLNVLAERGFFTLPAEDSQRSAGSVSEVVPWLKGAKVRYLTLCYGVPLRITRDPALIESIQSRLAEPLRRNEAAVDSELALLPAGLQSLPAVGPLVNPVFGETNAAKLHPTHGVWVVGRLDGPSVEIARGLVDKAINAETNGLWGRAYIDLRGLTNSQAMVGDQWLQGFGEMVRRAGYETIVDRQPATFSAAFPMSQIAFYAGWYDAEVSGPFTRKSVEFMPGAIAYHLHSFSAGLLRTTDRRWVGPLLAKGATATMGCVEEPYLELTPNLTTFGAMLIGFGHSFGEAALAAQPVLSWQITVLGDPLYRPMGVLAPGEHVGMRFARLQQDLIARQSPVLPWALLQTVNFRLALGQPPGALVSELEREPVVAANSNLQEKLGDLYFELGKLGDAIRAYEKALTLETSRQQQTRLLLALGQLQGIYGREKEALLQYERLLKEIADYPDPLEVYRKMLPLAQRINATEKTTHIQAEIRRLTPPPAQ